MRGLDLIIDCVRHPLSRRRPAVQDHPSSHIGVQDEIGACALQSVGVRRRPTTSKLTRRHRRRELYPPRWLSMPRTAETLSSPVLAELYTLICT